MKLPKPRIGLVIRYAFLWSHEKDAGATESGKDRPCAIVVASQTEGTTDTTVFAVPVTHRQPTTPDGWVERPSPAARALGLDGDRYWIIVTELNKFIWPGYDLRPVPQSGSYEYGMLPKDIFMSVQAALNKQISARRARAMTRDRPVEACSVAASRLQPLARRSIFSARPLECSPRAVRTAALLPKAIQGIVRLAGRQRHGRGMRGDSGRIRGVGVRSPGLHSRVRHRGGFRQLCGNSSGQKSVTTALRTNSSASRHPGPSPWRRASGARPSRGGRWRRRD